MKLHSYSSVYNLGHRYLENLFKDEVIIEEKVDGSQFSFGKAHGQLYFRSKGAKIFLPCENNLFKAACEYVVSIQDRLAEGWTYRGEVLWRPKHNSLAYSRVPKHNIVLFDIDMGDQRYLSYGIKQEVAEVLDLEVVPLLWSGLVGNYETLKEFFEKESFLGGCKIEGFVIKNYAQFGQDKKVLMGKWVSEAFKEVHSSEWKKSNPGHSDVIENIISMFKTEARWNKAVQHLKEQGLIQNQPQDIGILLKEISMDVYKECAEEIKEELFKQAWPKISRGISGGFPEWYKEQLAKLQFSQSV